MEIYWVISDSPSQPQPQITSTSFSAIWRCISIAVSRGTYVIPDATVENSIPLQKSSARSLLLNVQSCLFTQLLDLKLIVMKEKKGRTKLCKNLFDRDLKYARSLLLLLRRKIENMIILSYREVGFTKYAKAKF